MLTNLARATEAPSEDENKLRLLGIQTWEAQIASSDKIGRTVFPDCTASVVKFFTARSDSDEAETALTLLCVAS